MSERKGLMHPLTHSCYSTLINREDQGVKNIETAPKPVNMKEKQRIRKVVKSKPPEARNYEYYLFRHHIVVQK